MNHLLRDYFIPVAIDKQNLYKPENRVKNTREIELLHRMTGGREVYLGVHTVRPSGDLLRTYPTLPAHGDGPAVARFLKETIDRFGKVSPRTAGEMRAYADRGVGLRKDGSVRLAVTVRYMEGGRPGRAPIFDSIILSAADWKALMPPAGHAGSRYQIPASVARQFSRVLDPESDTTTLLLPQHIREAGMEGETGTSPQSSGEIHLSGHLAGERPFVNDKTQILPGAARMEGVLHLDANRQPTRLLMVFDGTFKMPWNKTRMTTAALVEWRLK